MNKTIQLRIDGSLKQKADNLFAKLGMNTSTAIRMFLSAAVKSGSFPFEIHHSPYSLEQAIRDVENRQNLSKPDRKSVV